MRWWRLFKSKLDSRSEPPASEVAESPQGPRRRASTRYDYRGSIELRCEGWPGFVRLPTGDVSETGLFVITASSANPGDRAQIMVPGAKQPLDALVRRRVEDGKHGAGLGIELGELDDAQRAIYTELLEQARSAAPRPQTDSLDIEAISDLGDDDVEFLDDDSLLVIDDSEVSEVTAGRETSKLENRLPSSVSPPPQPPPTPRARRSSGVIVGIDLGTTYTSVACVQGSKVVILENDQGQRSTPSVVSFPEQGRVVIGERDRIATDPSHTVTSPKRLLGRPLSDPEVERFVGQAPYRALEGPDGTVVIDMWGDRYAIPQLVGHLLAHARAVAESHLDTEVTQAVVSVPIAFDSERIEYLRRAGRMAGLDIVAVLDEPSAAALANRFDDGFGGVVGVYDFGGGTFDFSVVDVSRGDFQVLATAGDTWLGGDDFDHVLAVAAANQFWRRHKVDIKNQALEWQRLLFACERAKRTLTVEQRATIHVPEVLRTADGMIDLEFSIDRNVLRRAVEPIVAQSLATCDEALELVGMAPGDLSVVYLSGGTTYIPAVRRALAHHFGVPIRTGVPPEHAVCLGAAIHAAQLQLRAEATLQTRD